VLLKFRFNLNSHPLHYLVILLLLPLTFLNCKLIHHQKLYRITHSKQPRHDELKFIYGFIKPLLYLSSDLQYMRRVNLRFQQFFIYLKQTFFLIFRRFNSRFRLT
jgi:hypothetical protein